MPFYPEFSFGVTSKAKSTRSYIKMSTPRRMYFYAEFTFQGLGSIFPCFKHVVSPHFEAVLSHDIHDTTHVFLSRICFSFQGGSFSLRGTFQAYTFNQIFYVSRDSRHDAYVFYLITMIPNSQTFINYFPKTFLFSPVIPSLSGLYGVVRGYGGDSWYIR